MLYASLLSKTQRRVQSDHTLTGFMETQSAYGVQQQMDGLTKMSQKPTTWRRVCQFFKHARWTWEIKSTIDTIEENVLEKNIYSKSSPGFAVFSISNVHFKWTSVTFLWRFFTFIRQSFSNNIYSTYTTYSRLLQPINQVKFVNWRIPDQSDFFLLTMSTFRWKVTK